MADFYDDDLLPSAASDDPRAKLLTSERTLNQTDDLIASARRTAAATEEMGVGIIQDLEGQRNQLTGAGRSLDETNQNLTRANRIMKRIRKRITTNRLILVIVVLIILAILGFAGYYGYLKYEEAHQHTKN